MKCNFKALCLYLDDKLNETSRMEVNHHLEKCEICTDALFMIAQDRDTEAEATNHPRVADNRIRAV